MVLSAFLAEETGLIFFQQYLQFVLGETRPDQTRTTSHPSLPTYSRTRAILWGGEAGDPQCLSVIK